MSCTSHFLLISYDNKCFYSLRGGEITQENWGQPTTRPNKDEIPPANGKAMFRNQDHFHILMTISTTIFFRNKLVQS